MSIVQQDTETFKYDPLDLEGHSIRLLRLQNLDTTRRIECELFQVWLDDDFPFSYEALSYTWGSTELTESITVNGKTLYITENLYAALGCLRLKHTDRIVWIDAVCIDQQNLRERGHQVQQMGDIYSRAERVIFWLGTASFEITVLMDSLQQLQEESNTWAFNSWKRADPRWKGLWLRVKPLLKSEHPTLEEDLAVGLKRLLDRDWFRRVWVLQEVAHAKTAIVCAGTKSVSARMFALAPVLIRVRPEAHCQAVLDIMPGASRHDCWWKSDRDLYTLFVTFRESKATDERDKIFALLGIASDANMPNFPQPNYEKCVSEVVQDTAAYLFGGSHTSFNTVEDILGNLTLLNTKHLTKLLKSADESSITNFLSRCGEDIEVSESLFTAAASNLEHGADAMACLRKFNEDMTAEVMQTAARNPTSGKDLIANQLILDRKTKIPPEAIKAAVENQTSGKDILDVMLRLRPHEAKEVFDVVAEDWEAGWILIESLFKPQGSFIEVTDHIVKAIVSNEKRGKEMLRILLDYRPYEVAVTRKVLKQVALNSGCGPRVLELLLNNAGYVQKIDGLIIREDVLKLAINNEKGGPEMMELFVTSGKRAVFCKLQITADTMKTIVRNTKTGVEIMNLLIQHRPEQVILTEEVLEEIMRNRECGVEIMQHLLNSQSINIVITEEVALAAVDNRRMMELIRSFIFSSESMELMKMEIKPERRKSLGSTFKKALRPVNDWRKDVFGLQFGY